MLHALDDAQQQSADPPGMEPLVVTHKIMTGRRGRPRIEIDTTFLQQALELRGPTHIAPALACSSRTVRRRAVDAKIVQPAPAVFHYEPQPDGSFVRVHTSTTRPTATFDDLQLDIFVRDILEVFPLFGRSMLSGRLKAAGHNVPRDRIAASYLRVHGTPGQFGRRTIHRRAYAVAGANSLWHHDGQHGTSSNLYWNSVTHLRPLVQVSFALRWSSTVSSMESLASLLASVPVTTTALPPCFLCSRKPLLFMALPVECAVTMALRMFLLHNGWRTIEEQVEGLIFGAGKKCSLLLSLAFS